MHLQSWNINFWRHFEQKKVVSYEAPKSWRRYHENEITRKSQRLRKADEFPKIE